MKSNLFKLKPEKFFLDAKNFEIKRESDFISYTEFLNYFSNLKVITKHNLIIAINFTYGWMPTIFEFKSNKFDEALEVLNNIKKGRTVTSDNLDLLKGLMNNSLVGTSKILHFIDPINFAIWDSRVYRYLTKKEPYNYRIGNCKAYMDYLILCDYLTKQKEFDSLHKKVEKKVGYSITPIRSIELVIYSIGAKKK